MQNLFVTPNDEFEVNFCVATNSKNQLFCDINEEQIKMLLGDPTEYEIKSYKAIFKRPSFKDTIELYDSVFSTNDGANIAFNPLSARYKKIVVLIKSWDLKDGEGKEIEPNETNIQLLSPNIANVIAIQVDMETGGILS